MDKDMSKPWGRFATFGLGIFALLASQMIALPALIWWYQKPLRELSHLLFIDNVAYAFALTAITMISTPIEILLLVLFAQRTGESAATYLGWVWPRRSHVVFGIICVVALSIFCDVTEWLFNYDIYRSDTVSALEVKAIETARAGGWLVWFFVAAVIVVPMGEETLFRGFLFRGWLKSSRDVWPVIGVTSIIFALLHVQYDVFGIAQVLAFGLLFGWMRWASGSSILTMFMHGLYNLAVLLEALSSLDRVLGFPVRISGA